MIIDPPKQPGMTTQPPQDSPPSYDDAAGGSGNNNNISQGLDAKPLIQPQLVQVHTGLIHTVQQPGLTPSPVIHHYTNPVTGERVASLLPPDHPEMICLQRGMHEPQSQFGLLGILAAIFWFPLGIGLCILDRRVRCERCGAHLNDALCD